MAFPSATAKLVVITRVSLAVTVVAGTKPLTTWVAPVVESVTNPPEGLAKTVPAGPRSVIVPDDMPPVELTSKVRA